MDPKRIEFTFLEIMETIKEAYDKAWEIASKSYPVDSPELQKMLANRHLVSYMKLYEGIKENFKQVYDSKE